jgi:chromosome segregation ATPase
MGIESIMYFALGVLVAALVALMILPAIWRRAVRLTRKRIEAATPMSMAEFRADKDRLRAEFALSTRRLEMTIETLRKRLAEQVGDISLKKNDLSALKTERDQHQAIVAELEDREVELRSRVLELEKKAVDLAQRLRMRNREYEAKADELEAVREALRANLPHGTGLERNGLSGVYDDDIEELLTALAIERKRASFLEEQMRRLVVRLESSDRRSVDTNAAIAELRRALAIDNDTTDEAASELVVAQAHMASAGNRLNALIEQAEQGIEGENGQPAQLLAEKLSLEDQVVKLKKKVLGVEAGIMADWGTPRADRAKLRERLGDIASEVSRLVYVADGQTVPEAEESLFDRVQKFADDGRTAEEFSIKPGPGPQRAGNGKPGKVTARMAALRDIQSRR